MNDLVFRGKKDSEEEEKKKRRAFESNTFFESVYRYSVLRLYLHLNHANSVLHSLLQDLIKLEKDEIVVLGEKWKCIGRK